MTSLPKSPKPNYINEKGLRIPIKPSRVYSKKAVEAAIEIIKKGKEIREESSKNENPYQL